MGITVSSNYNIVNNFASAGATITAVTFQTASIIVISIGALVLLVLAGVVIYFFWKKHRRGRKSRKKEEKILARLIEKGLVSPDTRLPDIGNEVIESIKL